jgi:gliding motility-associated-like protein
VPVVNGCTDATAFNYNPAANTDNGSCVAIVNGCLDNTACNYSPLANVSDNSCVFSPSSPNVSNVNDIHCGEVLGSVEISNASNFSMISVNGVLFNSSSIISLGEGNWQLVAIDTNFTGCISDTIAVTILSIADCNPIAVNDSLTIVEDTNGSVSVLLNDSDGDGNLNNSTVDLDVNTPGIQNVWSDANGVWTVDANGVVSFAPASNFNGTAILSYVVSDSTGLISNAGQLVIDVIPANDAPVIVLDEMVVNTPYQTSIDICIEVTDPDGDNLAITEILDAPSNGVVTGVIGSDTCFTYLPNAGFSGVDSMMITICDAEACDSIWVFINVGEAPIVVANDDNGVVENGSLIIDILSNDLLNGNTDFNVMILDSTQHGSLILVNNQLTYVPDIDYCGTDSLSYMLCNGTGYCDTAMVYLQVTPTDSDGDGIPDYIETLTLDTDGDGVFNYLSTDSDGDGKPDAEESGLTNLCDTQLADCDNDGIADYVDETNCSEEVVFPEGFSPNGDGINDSWQIPNIENYPDNEVVIYNRWGNVVYQAQPYRNDWLGESNQAGLAGGKFLPEGTYFYVVKLKADEEAKLGYVYIKR